MDKDDLFAELDSLIDLDAGGETARSLADPASPPLVRPQRVRIPPGRPLYLDLETVPDYERLPQFGLPVLPAPIPPTPLEACPNQIQLATLASDAVLAEMGKINPPDEWLMGMELAERAGKNRKGVLTKISDLRATREAGGRAGQAASDRSKLLSVTPEYCKIAAMGWCGTDAKAKAMVVGDGCDELEIVEAFWTLTSKADPIVLYNGIWFDLPVMFVRSAMFLIEPGRRFDLRTWGTDVVDLYKVRWPSGPGMKMKDLARTLGIDIPCPDVDGGAVEGLVKAGEFQKIAEYVKSDVVVLVGIHQFYSGFFCP